MSKRIYVKDNISNSMAASLYKYGHHYDSLETDIETQKIIKRAESIIFILNSKLFSFISEVNIVFDDDFDCKINFHNLPLELNNIIKSYLITEKSINFNLYNLTDLYTINYDYHKISNKIIYKLKFELKNEYLNNILKYNEIDDFIRKLPNYLFMNDYGIIINSQVNRELNITTTYMNYNNESFYNYKNKYLKSIGL